MELFTVSPVGAGIPLIATPEVNPDIPEPVAHKEFIYFAVCFLGRKGAVGLY